MSAITRTSGSVTYDNRGFIVDGKRLPLLSGAVHYFRLPRRSWRNVLRKSRLAGLTCIETYVAWNVHEPGEGSISFDGERDLGHFIDLCADEGLYVIVRPGPYICAEWSFGGLPAWLLSKPGIRLREDSPAFLDAIDRWFDRLTPVVTERQRTRGGPVILVQVENEFGMVEHVHGEAGRRYLLYLRDGLRARGIEVPLLTCKGHLDGCIECINGLWPSRDLPVPRASQPDAPLFSTEFWCGWYDVWNAAHHARDGAQVAREAARFLALGGAGYNLYMWFGGTNFGNGAMHAGTASYDYDAPISETLASTPKYHALRRLALFARTVPAAATGEAVDPTSSGAVIAVDARGDALVAARHDEHGTAIIAAPGEWGAGSISMRIGADGVPVEAAHNAEPVLLVADYNDPDSLGDYRVRWTSACVLAVVAAPAPTIVVHGPEGRVGEVAVERGGTLYRLDTPFVGGEEPSVTTAGALSVVSMATALTERTWLLDLPDGSMRVVVGPVGVDEWQETGGRLRLRVRVAPWQGARPVIRVLDGGAWRVASTEPPTAPALPGLAWQVRPAQQAFLPDWDDSAWQKLPGPASMLSLEPPAEGYCWYRASAESRNGGPSTLHVTYSGHLAVYVNGERAGATQPPPEDRSGPSRADFSITLRAGANSIAILADALGLSKGEWMIGASLEHEGRGLHGPATIDDADLHNWRARGALDADEAAGTPGAWLEPTEESFGRPHWCRGEFVLPSLVLQQGLPIRLRLDGLSKGRLWLNGHDLGRYWTVGPQLDHPLPVPWLAEHNTILLLDEQGCVPSAASLCYDAPGLALAVDVMI